MLAVNCKLICKNVCAIIFMILDVFKDYNQPGNTELSSTVKMQKLIFDVQKKNNVCK